MKIVFLDVDGVLNSEAWFSQRPRPKRFSVDPKLVSRARLLCTTGSSVVISSSWRHKMRPEHLLEILEDAGLYGVEVAGFTPVLYERKGGLVVPCERGLEIESWLDENSNENIVSFVIIDDDNDMGKLKRYLVQTDAKIGISDNDVYRAIEILDEENRWPICRKMS